MINFDKWNIYLNTNALFSSLMTLKKDIENDYARVRSQNALHVVSNDPHSSSLTLFTNVKK